MSTSILAQRTDESTDSGFTLIELMVVVLVMGILLAIAVPTYLNSRSGSQDRSAQSSAHSALLAAKSIFQKSGSYAEADSAGLSEAEGAYTFQDGGDSTGPRVISVDHGTTTFALAVLSESGTCYYIADASGTGTTYGSSTEGTCDATALPDMAANW